MIPLNLPPFSIKLRRRSDGQPEIFDFLRRRYVALTPEEWVRQHFTHFLVEHLHYPAALLGNEISLNVNGSRRRCDTVLFRPDGSGARAIVEYKAPDVGLRQHTVAQISAYNTQLHADYLFLSNGLQHVACRINYATRSAEFLNDIPPYAAL